MFTTIADNKKTQAEIRYLSFIHVKLSHIRQLPSLLLQRQGTDYSITLSNIVDLYGLNFELNKMLYVTYFWEINEEILHLQLCFMMHFLICIYNSS